MSLHLQTELAVFKFVLAQYLCTPSFAHNHVCNCVWMNVYWAFYVDIIWDGVYVCTVQPLFTFAVCASCWSSVCNFKSKLSRCHSFYRQMGDLMLKPESTLISFSFTLSDLSLFASLSFFILASVQASFLLICLLLWQCHINQIKWGFPKPENSLKNCIKQSTFFNKCPLK